MENKQTAVEWLIDKLSNIKAEDFNSTLEVRLIIQQAKELERQQKGYSEEDMREAFIAGGNSRIEEDDCYGTEYLAYMEEWFEQFKK